GELKMLRNAFPRLRFVHIVRRHKLRQALSTARALQTGLWKVQEGKTALREPQFDAQLIEQSLREAERQENIWYTFFQRIGIVPFQVDYEELCRDYDATIRGVLDYLMSVIISRALPDARDGLKPSQRRILYAMHDLSLFPGRQHRKCAKICGDTSGNYHPHGEAVIYPTLVHMAQPWAMRETLVNG